MNLRFRNSLALLLVAVGVACLGQPASPSPGSEPGPGQRVNFSRAIRPILSDRCFKCHGPDDDQRQADLRLDRKDGLFGVGSGEAAAIVTPGEPEKSELFLRLVHSDEQARMPPADSGLRLSEAEVELIRQWIEQGAPWEEHWSFAPLASPAPPAMTGESRWPGNEIDRFVLAKLAASGASPAAEADRETLARRLSFDLTGLPPSLEELDAFLADESPAALERYVDRLLASPRFGERMAVDWLDLARYADTFGYQTDVYRATWPWRDWVVSAINANLPYDEFVTWQLAGDLLPSPSQEQVLATAFNRHHRQTNEGGSIEEEFRAEYVADRVNTFGAAFLGLTLECSRCHDHKYDPVMQRDYYALAAFFNNIDESGLYSHFTDAMPTPTLLLASEEQRAAAIDLERRIAEGEAHLAALKSDRLAAFREWLLQAKRAPETPGLIGHYPLDEISDGRTANAVTNAAAGTVSEGPNVTGGKVGGAFLFSGENNVEFTTGGEFGRDDPFSIDFWMQTPDRKERAVIFHRSRAWTDAGSRGYELLIEDGKLSAALIHFWPGNAIRVRTTTEIPLGTWLHVAMTYDGSSRAAGLALFIDGRPAPTEIVRDNLRKDILGGGATTLTIGQRFRDRGFKDGLVDDVRVFDRALTALEIAQIHDGHALADALLTAAQAPDSPVAASLLEYYLATADAPYREQLASLRDLRKQRTQLVEPIPEIMVMREMAGRRPTHVLKRGAYNAPGETVEPGVPPSLPPFPSGLPKNRLGLAAWLTDPEHPLTARVAVNRYWQAIFGRGLVATPEDFGSQGAAPSHPELLDWLARDFIQSGWDVKRLIKRIVTSATYRQASRATPAERAADADNLLLSRAPRRRLPAEMIRDGALAAGGLLVEKLGGPAVKPYQPDGLWEEKSGLSYQRDVGEGSHRRSLYTYWKRTSPPPAMITFDAANREVCVVKRPSTATPLQALVLLNDPQYVEAARGLAQRAIREAPGEPERRLAFAFRVATSRRPEDKELAILRELYDDQLSIFRSSPADAEALLSVGDLPRLPAATPPELASLTVACLALLNHDEAVTSR